MAVNKNKRKNDYWVLPSPNPGDVMSLKLYRFKGVGRESGDEFHGILFGDLGKCCVNILL